MGERNIWGLEYAATAWGEVGRGRQLKKLRTLSLSEAHSSLAWPRAWCCQRITMATNHEKAVTHQGSVPNL